MAVRAIVERSDQGMPDDFKFKFKLFLLKKPGTEVLNKKKYSFTCLVRSRHPQYFNKI